MKKLLSLLMVLTLCGCSSSGGVSFFSEDETDDGLWQYSRIDHEPVQAEEKKKKNWTVEFWIKPDSNYPGTGFFSLEEEYHALTLTGSDRLEEGFVGPGLVETDKGLNSSVHSDAGISIASGQWNLISITQTSGKGILCALNGEEILRYELQESFHNPVMRIGSSGIDNRISVEGYVSALRVFSSSRDLSEIRQEYQEKYPAVLLDQLHYPDQDRLQRSLWLDSNSIAGVPVTWTVLDPDKMDYRGIIADLDTESDIKAKASITTEYGSAEKTFTFHVAGADTTVKLEDDLRSLDADIRSVMHSGETLPQTGPNGSVITYEILSGVAEYFDGMIIKTGGPLRQPVTIKAVLQLEDETLEKEYNLVLLESIYGYAMSYFNGEDGEETGYIAVSEDGLSWQKTNTVIQAESGTGRVRDPYLARAADGSFLITATQGFDNPEVYLWQSEDLKKLENEQLILVDLPDEGLGTSGKRAWAPVIYHDRETGDYLLIYSDPSPDHGAAYAVRTKDFRQFSYPYKLFDPLYPTIDTVMFTDSGRYWLFYKDERAAAQTVYYAMADDPELGFTRTFDWQYLNRQRGVEGPMLCRKKDGGWLFYIDDFPHRTFLAGTFDHMSDQLEIHWYEAGEYSLPEEDVRHGSLLPLTETEYKDLIAE